MRVGILGGGQLARMLALAGLPLGVRCLCLDPAPDACAGAVAEQVIGGYDDPEALARLAERVEVITYEFENVPETAVAFLANRLPVFPGGGALAIARDRLREKNLFQQLGIATPSFAAVESREDLHRAADRLGLPAVLKTRTLGYDGKGQRVLREPGDLVAAWEQLGGVPLILESFVTFEREVSIIAARGRNGDMVFYPLAENEHREGILRLSQSRPDDPLASRAREQIRRLLTHLNYVGILALELFQSGDSLLANEMAPRVHNSGHWSIEGAETSQFENHLRAILDLPLGAADPVGHAAMLNFIGEIPASKPILAIPGAHLHLYQKAARPGRKLGHVTLRAETPAQLAEKLKTMA